MLLVNGRKGIVHLGGLVFLSVWALEASVGLPYLRWVLSSCQCMTVLRPF